MNSHGGIFTSRDSAAEHDNSFSYSQGACGSELTRRATCWHSFSLAAARLCAVLRGARMCLYAKYTDFLYICISELTQMYLNSPRYPLVRNPPVCTETGLPDGSVPVVAPSHASAPVPRPRAPRRPTDPSCCKDRRTPAFSGKQPFRVQWMR